MTKLASKSSSSSFRVILLAGVILFRTDHVLAIDRNIKLPVRLKNDMSDVNEEKSRVSDCSNL